MTSRSVQIFGDVLIPGTEYVVLERLLAAYRWWDEEAVEAYWQVSFSMASISSESKVRIWWRITQFAKPDSQESVSYISLNPAEHRTKIPDQPCEIRDLKVNPFAPKCRDILQAARDACNRVPVITSHEASLIKSADVLLNSAVDKTAQNLLKDVSEAAKKMTDQEFQLVWNKFYERGLFEFGLTRIDFTSSVLLLQLQRCSGLWVVEDWYSEPVAFLNGFVNKLISSSEHRSRVLAILPDEANREFKTAGAELKQALIGSTMEQMTRRLMLSSHRFETALLLHHYGSALGARPDLFRFSQNLAEEGFVCTNTGITLAAEFCSWHKDELPLSFLEECGPHLTSLTRKAAGWASSVSPVFTRTFSEIVAAQALALSANLTDVRSALVELERLEGVLRDQTLGEVDFEQAWLNQILLHVSKRLGDESATKRYAYRIAGRLVLQSVFKQSHRD